MVVRVCVKAVTVVTEATNVKTSKIHYESIKNPPFYEIDKRVDFVMIQANFTLFKTPYKSSASCIGSSYSSVKKLPV